MSSDAGETVHATCVSIGGAGVLLLGPSGCGKSDLALRLLNSCAAGEAQPCLVSDDQVVLANVDGRLFASPPGTIAGRLEVRGVGVITVPHVSNVELSLAVELVSPHAVPRLPDRDSQRLVLIGVGLPRFRLAPFEASAPAKIHVATHAVVNSAFSEELARDTEE